MTGVKALKDRFVGYKTDRSVSEMNGMYAANVKTTSMLDFDRSGALHRLPHEFVEKLWGNEVVVCNRPNYCCKIINVFSGRNCSLHFHKVKDETFTVLSGTLQVEMWKNLEREDFELEKHPFADRKADLKMVLEAGSSVRVPPFFGHRFACISKSTASFVETSTTDFPEDSYRVVSATVQIFEDASRRR